MLSSVPVAQDRYPCHGAAMEQERGEKPHGGSNAGAGSEAVLALSVAVFPVCRCPAPIWSSPNNLQTVVEGLRGF